jgi:23S rRNA (pseudouridine1915-N3)-methyltransferase
MKINVLCIGKTNEKYLVEGIEIYKKRLKHYINFELEILPDVKLTSDPNILIQREGNTFLQKIDKEDFLVICDEKGKQNTSIQFASFLQNQMNQGTRKVIFMIGGAFGIDQRLKQRANQVLSLSDMTFSHQMIRLFLVEQIYRGFTIIKNEKYHNE